MIKNIVIFSLCLIFMSGCGKIDTIEDDFIYLRNSVKQEEIITYNKEKKTKNKFYRYMLQKNNKDSETYLKENMEKYGDENLLEYVMNTDLNDVLNTMEKIDDVEIIQESGKKVEIYKDSKYEDIILITDREKSFVNYALYSFPTEYNEFIKNIESKSEFFANSFQVNGNKKMLSFSNKEFLFFSHGNNVIFSETYNDVKIDLKNVPLKFIIFFEDNKISEINIVSISVLYNDIELSEKNIEQMKSIFELLDIKNYNEIIDLYKKEYFNKKNIKVESENYNIKTVKNIQNFKRYKYNDFIIQFNN